MQKLNFLISLIILICISFPSSAKTIKTDYNEDSYREWIADLKKEAEILGYKSEYINSIIDNAEYLPKVVELDRRQPEFNKTFWMYLNSSITSQRIRTGQSLIKKHSKLLNEIEKKYGVPPRFIVAFLGLESNYGKNTGNFKVVNSLVTLSYDNRRGKFFRNELFNLLSILNEGTIKNSNVLGSWAGAMGQIQFMPSTYKNYAIDENNDGVKDIWNSLPDIFASAANYLNKIGWQKKYTWGREVIIPETFDFLLADLTIKQSLSEWDKLGIKKINGQALPKSDINASVILPGGMNGPAFLVYKNFEVIKTWNNSILYSISIGHLADRIIGLNQIQKPRLIERPLSRSQIVMIQKNLNALGFSAGSADGKVGPKTRSAIRAFQQVNDLPPDGYADIKVLEDSITKIQGTAQN